MSVLTQQSFANKDTAFFLLANASTLNVNNISTGSLAANTISTNVLSSGVAFIHDVEASTLYALTLQLDNQVLTANPSELLLNGVPLATTSNLSSIADWALDPAISTVQMGGNNLLGASTISCITLVADQGIIATNLNAGNGIFSNLIAFNSMFVSTHTSSISSVVEAAELGLFSTLNADNISSATSVISTILTTEITLDNQTLNATPTDLLLNGVPIATVSSLSTIADWSYDPALTDVNMNGFSLLSTNTVSTQAMYVSSINGAEFTSTTIRVEVAGVSSLVANSISSIGAELRTALVSTLQFNPSFSPSLGGVNVNLGLGSILGNVIGWGAGVFGAAAGTIGMATGIASLAMGRQQDYIDNTKYELINGTTQIQFSTLGDSFSTIYRFNDSADPERIPGSTIYVSTISPPGLAIRAMSDPINTVSTPNSTIQAFGQWVPVPTPAAPVTSTISSFETLFTSSIGLSSITFGGAPNLTLKQTAAGQIGALDPTDNFSQVAGVEFWSRGSLTDANFGVYSRSAANRAKYTDSNFVAHNLLYTADDLAAISTLSTTTINMDVNGTINLLEGNASIQLGTASAAAGSLNAGANPSLILDGASSEVAVPTVNTDNLGGKNFTTIDVAATLNMLTGNNINFNGNEVLTSALLTIPTVSTSAVITSSVNGGIPYTTAFPPASSESFSSLKVSTLQNLESTLTLLNTINNTSLQLDSAGDIVGVAQDAYVNFQTLSSGTATAGLVMNALGAGGAGSSSNYAGGPMYLNASSIKMSTNLVMATAISTANLQVSTINLVQPQNAPSALVLSSLIYLSTAALNGVGTSTTTYVNTDLSLLQNDLYCQQIRIGYGQGSGTSSSIPEVVLYPPNVTDPKSLNVANADKTIRILSTTGANNAGYLLDTLLNPPLFSTINNQVNLVAWFPSTIASTIGYSTISKMNPVSLYGRSTLAGGTVTIVFSPPYANSNEYNVALTYKDTAGGAPLHANILSVSSFSANGSATNDFFWQTIGQV